MGDHGVVAKAPTVMMAIIAAILPRVRRATPTPRSNNPVRIRYPTMIDRVTPPAAIEETMTPPTNRIGTIVVSGTVTLGATARGAVSAFRSVLVFERLVSAP
ncbi:hypothetical protein GCM10020255_073800 [Rhodococcus baikonurensis]